jgi:hypothetical protein
MPGIYYYLPVLVLNLGLLSAEAVRRRSPTGYFDGQRARRQAALCVVANISPATGMSPIALVVIWLAFAVIGDLLRHITAISLGNYRTHARGRDVASSAYSSAAVLWRRGRSLASPIGARPGRSPACGRGCGPLSSELRASRLRHPRREGQCLLPDQADTAARGLKTSRSQMPGVCAKESGKLRSRIRRASWNRKLSGWPRPKS